MKNEKKKETESKTGMLDHFEVAGAHHLLQLGRQVSALLADSEGGGSAEAMDGALTTLRTFLDSDAPPEFLKALGAQRGVLDMDARELRIVSYIAFCQLYSKQGCATLQEAAHAGAPGDDRPEMHLDNQLLCGQLLAQNILRRGEGIGGSCCLYLGNAMIRHFFGGVTSPLAILYQDSFDALKKKPPEAAPKDVVPAKSSNSGAERKNEAPAVRDETPPPGHRHPHAPSAPPGVNKLSCEISRCVIGLERQVCSVSARVNLHMARRCMVLNGKGDPETPNECLLFIGPSGCGKTWLAETAGRVAGVPFSAVNSTDITCEGYIGLSADDALKPLITAAQGRLELARHGICFLDEWDKKAKDRSGRFDRDVSGSSVQQSFLRIMEGCMVPVGGRRTSSRESHEFNTRGTMFIFAGAFVGLEDLLKKRREDGAGGLGFGTGTVRRNSRQRYLRDALTEFGMIPEFLNRLTGILCFPEPTLEQLKDIITSERGALQTCNRLLSSMGMGLQLGPGAADVFASYALETATLARGIKSIFCHIEEWIQFNGTKGLFTIRKKQAEEFIASMESGMAA